MTAQHRQKISILVIWPAMACMVVCLACAQSNSGSLAASVPDPSAQFSSRSQGNPNSAIGQKASKGSRQTPGTASMASQWTAGAKTFGAANDQSWENKDPSFDTDNGTAWHPGTDAFGAGPQPGGIWVVSGALERGQESTPQNASQRIIQAGTGNSTQGLNPSSAGNLARGMTPSTTGNSSLPGSSLGAPWTSLAAPGTAPWSYANSIGENAFQRIKPPISANSFSAVQSFESSSNRWAASAMRPQMKSFLSARRDGIGMQSQGRTGSRSARGFGSFGGSTMGQSPRMTVGSFRSSSRSFGGGGRPRGRSSGSRRSGGSTRESFSESSNEQRRNSDSLLDSEHLHTGLGADLGSRNQRLGSQGMESGLNKPGTGNRREPSGKSRSNRGLNTHLPH
jgi:hypothetical protein